MNEQQYMTITALTRYIKRKFDQDFNLKQVWVRGELSNVKLHSRGHMYFTIKDENSRIQAVMFAGNNRHLKFKPENGMKVLIQGEVSVYEPHGQYQFYAREMQPDGIGNLFLAYEELKKKLEKEGLFSQEIKKPLPPYPTRVAVITSPTGAAIRDVLTTIKRRFPITKVTVIPVLVQGIEAGKSIAKAIEKANHLNNWDLLIVGRGGGSIEELWAFNEEIVARSIYHSQIPIISAVGHETDYTISDFVADVRAATPTAAAEIAVPNLLELFERIEHKTHRLTRAMNENLSQYRKKLDYLATSYAFKYPMQLIKQKEQQLDQTFEQLKREMNRNLTTKKDRSYEWKRWLYRYHPQKQVNTYKNTLKSTTKTLQKEMNRNHKENVSKFQQRLSQLEALNPLKVMGRGYGLVYNQTDNIVKSVKQVQPGDTINVELTDGKLDCQIWGIEERDRNE